MKTPRLAPAPAIDRPASTTAIEVVEVIRRLALKFQNRGIIWDLETSGLFARSGDVYLITDEAARLGVDVSPVIEWLDELGATLEAHFTAGGPLTTDSIRAATRRVLSALLLLDSARLAHAEKTTPPDLQDLDVALKHYIDDEPQSDSDGRGPINQGHPVHRAVVALEEFYPGRFLPDEIRPTWISLLRASRTGKTKEAMEYAKTMRTWCRSAQLPVRIVESNSGGKGGRSAPALIASKRSGIEPLTDYERAVKDLIAKQKGGSGISGKEILEKLDKTNMVISASYLRDSIIPRLKRDHHVKNRRGVGYYVDAPK